MTTFDASNLLLIRSKAIQIHYVKVDCLMMAGQYQQAPPLPYTPGMEYSGTVVSSSGNSGVSPGDRVCVADMINAGKSCLKYILLSQV